VCCALARTIRRLAPGARLLGLKPIETGITPASDARALAEACGNDPDLADPCYPFEPPLSPHLAARLAGTVILPERLRAWAAEREASCRATPTLTLIETAGGAFTPLGPTFFNADLVALLRPSLTWLVAPDRLGVLHDVGATLRALRALRIDVDAVVLSAAQPRDRSTGTNAAELETLDIFSPCVGVGQDDDTALVALTESLLSRLG
jgi:dethiobiotin synthetase